MPLSNRHQIPIRIVLIHSISNKCHEMYKKCIIEVFRDLLGNILQPRRSTWNIAHTNSLSTSPWRLIFKGISCYMNPVQLKFLKKHFFLSNESFACFIVFVRETLQNALARLDRKRLLLYIAQRRHVFSVIGFSYVGADANIRKILSIVSKDITD